VVNTTATAALCMFVKSVNGGLSDHIQCESNKITPLRPAVFLTFFTNG